MALRPIDNALPVSTPERPKKQIKVNISQAEFGVNDENKIPLPQQQPPADAAIDYIPSDDLKPISDPEFKIQGLIDGLESKDWTRVCESLNDARRFALHHFALLLPIMEKVMIVIVKAMKNPRSALCKTSIMASSDIFSAFGDKLLDSTTGADAAFDQLLLQLLLKASQDKKFVCEEADKTLNAMVKSMTPLTLLHKLRAYAKHANPRVRAKVAICISNCVTTNMGLEGMKEFGLVELVQMAADLLNDRLPEAREAARNVVISVYKAYTKDEEQKEEFWQNFCQSNLSALQAQSMTKITSSQ